MIPARPAFIFLLLGLAAADSAQAQNATLPAATMFIYPWASGESSDSSDEPPTSRGRTMLFERGDAHTSKIFESHLIHGRWSAPVATSFSGPWSDQFPALSPDGRYVIFESDRPIVAGGDTPERVANLWRVEKTSSGWSKPEHLPDTVNISKRIYAHSIAANGDIYFMSSTEPRGKDPRWRLFHASHTANGYAQAEPLPFSDGSTSDVDPYVAPDQSYLIFSSRNRREPTGHEHLYITLRRGADWGPVTPIRYQGDAQAENDYYLDVSSDGKTLYFDSARGGTSKMWTLALAPYLSAAPSASAANVTN